MLLSAHRSPVLPPTLTKCVALWLASLRTGCQNQKFTRKQYAKLDIERTGRKGHGLFVKQDLRKGQFIIEYIGEVGGVIANWHSTDAVLTNRVRVSLSVSV